jgi:hypothetical protein
VSRYYVTSRSPGTNLLGTKKGSWNASHPGERLNGIRDWTWVLSQSKTDGGRVHVWTIAEQNAEDPWDVMFGRWVTAPLDAQTISGTFNTCIPFARTADINLPSATAKIRVYIYITQGDTLDVRHVLLDYTDSVAIPGTRVAMALASAQSLSSGSTSSGDRVVMELGVRFSPNVASDDVTLFDTQAFMDFGTQPTSTGAANPDAAVGNSGVNFAYYVDFSHTFVELAAPSAPVHDACADAIEITTLPYNAANINTTTSADTDRAVWYQWTAPSTMQPIVATWGSNYRNQIDVFTGTCGSLTGPISPSGTFGNSAGTQWIQNSQAHISWPATSGTTYYIRITNATDDHTARNSGGSLTIKMVQRQVIQEGDQIINAKVVTAWRDCELIDVTPYVDDFVPTGAAMDLSGREIDDFNGGTYSGPRLFVTLFDFEWIELFRTDAGLHPPPGDNSLGYLDLLNDIKADGPTDTGGPGEHASSIVFDSAGNIYVGFFGDNYDEIGALSTPVKAWIRKYDAINITSTPPNFEADLLAIYEVELENQGTDYIELSQDQRTMFYTSAGRRILRYDVVDDIQLSDFATLAAESGPRPGLRGLRLLPPGDGSAGLLVTDGINVKRLNSSGVVIQTYTPTETALAQDLDKVEISGDGTRFWVTDQLSTTMFEFNLATGEQLGTCPTYLPTGQLCGFTGPGNYRAAVSEPFELETPPDIVDNTDLCPCPPLPPLTPEEPTEPPWIQPEIGDLLDCTGGGLVPTAADLVHSEIWWGEPHKSPRRWLEFALEPYPAGSPVGSDTTFYKWAQRPYAGPQFIEGRVTLDGWQSIRRAASGMSGEYHIDSAAVLVADNDGLIRSLLDGISTKWFRNREAALHLLSEAAYGADLAPRIEFAGRCYDAQLEDQRKARLEFEDLLAPYMDRIYPQYTLGDAYPFRFEGPDEELDGDLNAEDPGLQIPRSLRDQVMPIYYGPFVDTAVDSITGLPRQKGLVPTYFMGYTFLTSGTGTIPEPSPEIAAILESSEFAFPAVAGWGGWGELFVCLGEVDVPNLYTSNLAPTPERFLIGEDHYGVDVIAPGHANWPFPTDYVIRNGFRCTVIYARGPILWHHIIGLVSITVDVCGWKNADGVAIDQAAFVYQDFITQHVLAHDGDGFTSGPQVGLPLYANGVPMFWTSKVQDFQTITGERLGTAKGYLCSMALDEPKTLREILRTWHITFDAFSAKNAAGQLYPFVIDDLADPADGVAVRERIELVTLPHPRIAWDEIENEMDYVVGWDPEQKTFRTPTKTIRDDAAIAALKEVRKKGIRELKYTADDETAIDVIGRRLMRLKEPPIYQPLPVKMGGVDREIGEQVRVSHRDGIGPPLVGYSDRAMVLLEHGTRDTDITLLALDIDQILALSARWTTDSVPDWESASTVEQASLGFWADDDDTIPTDGASAKEWR